MMTLPVKGGVNFRDIGGLPTSDGRTRHQTVYRSGLLSSLGPDDRATLDSLGIRLVCDFRSRREQAHRPYTWLPAGAEAADYGQSASGDLTALGGPLGNLNPMDDVRRMMLVMYRDLPEHHADRYATAFKAIATGKVPAILACTAGKDRTGVAIALLLSLVGTAREAIIENYALSDQVFDFHAWFMAGADRAQHRGRENDPLHGLFRKVGADAMRPLMASDPDYVVAALEATEARYGSIAGYARERLAMDDPEIERLREFLVE